MLRKFTFLFLASVFSAPVFAKTLKCSAADSGGHNEKNVRVTYVHGAEIFDPIITRYGIYDLAVEYQLGDQYESQTSIGISANSYGMLVRDVSSKSAYSFFAPDLWLQCWFE